MTAPTSTRGWVDPYQLDTRYGSLYADVLEHIPDLAWPESVNVYARMRRDPQLAAIQQSWTLQLRRAQWQVDPAGCRPEVVALVADGLGLHVAGTDEPGPARLRGVSWNDHLAAALRMLTFGHAGFELEADTSDGRVAKLAGLWERPQWTISHLHVNGKTGLLEGVTQDAAYRQQSPQISADRLAWYVNEREGANWAGTSLLRPAYASWLIKEELRRVHAIANRRFGMGVPVMEALPGTNPTGGQMAEAMQMAAAVRAGEQSGAASPPGFALKLIGLTGAVPDTLAFIRWLDQQMSRAALMGMLDLGETPNGSRALGETFVDAFLLALESCAEAVADTATRQIAARIVDWNWGADEPVPRVVVSGVGSRREVTAESLKMLLDSGALAADPALEAWVRREYRLPEQTGPAPQPATNPPPAAAANTRSARPRARRTKAAGQLTLFNSADDPEPDHEAIQEQWEQAKDALLKRWPRTAKPMVDELADQAEDAAASGDLAQLADLSVSAGVIAAVALVLGDKGSKVAKQAAAQVVAEAAAQQVDIESPDQPGEDRVRQTADLIASLIASGYQAGATRAALQHAGADPATVRDEVKAHLDELGKSAKGLVGDHVGALLSAAQNAGRIAVLEAHPADRYRAVEVNDTSQCEPCAEVAGREFTTLAKAVAAYPVAGFKDCAGGLRCRGFVFPLFESTEAS